MSTEPHVPRLGTAWEKGVERFAADLIELSTRQNSAQFLAAGDVLRGWARSACGERVDAISCIEDGIRDWRATGSMWSVPIS
jgi:hypothetical protein